MRNTTECKDLWKSYKIKQERSNYYQDSNSDLQA